MLLISLIVLFSCNSKPNNLQEKEELLTGKWEASPDELIVVSPPEMQESIPKMFKDSIKILFHKDKTFQYLSLKRNFKGTWEIIENENEDDSLKLIAKDTIIRGVYVHQRVKGHWNETYFKIAAKEKNGRIWNELFKKIEE
jgi:hypothetical protein